MDPYKLLSRSTTLSKRTEKHLVPNTPSTGAAKNPQLFGKSQYEAHAHAQASSGQNSKKRKRNQEDRLKSGQQTSVPQELDFFGDSNDGYPSSLKVAAARKSGDEARTDTSQVESGQAAGGDTSMILGEDECKRILRSHKLKITVLDNGVSVEDRPHGRKTGSKLKSSKNSGSEPKAAKREIFPQPLLSFAQLQSHYGIHARLADNVEKQGYRIPTEVQLGALPLLLDGSMVRGTASKLDKGNHAETPKSSPSENDVDLITAAPTGSGKTLAFLIPVVHALIRERMTQHGDGSHRDQEWHGPRAIVIVPTRELAAQIVNEGRKLTLGTGVKITLMRKGMILLPRDSNASSSRAVDDAASVHSASDSDNDSNDMPSNGHGETISSNGPRQPTPLVKADIMISTPLALLNALKRDTPQPQQMSNVRYLVLDEADVLLDPLFREQTLDVWKSCVNPLLRVSFWSATMGSNIEELVKSTIDERWQTLGQSESLTSQRPALVRLVVGLKDSAIPNIAHKLTYAATEQGKLMALRQLLRPTAPSQEPGPSLRPPFLVFTQTIPRAVALHSELLYDIPPEAGGSARIAVLHSGLSDTARDRIMTRFRKGEVWVLITTDLLARGVDFRGVNGVVNYDVPNSSAAYVHRAGRTGRAGREGGVAVTLYTKEDIPYIKNVANLIAAAEKSKTKGPGAQGSSVQQWLLESLPTLSKRDKKQLKKRGVEFRNSAAEKKLGVQSVAKTRISTKSGFERRLENNRRGAVASHRARRDQSGADDGAVATEGSESEFAGFDD